MTGRPTIYGRGELVTLSLRFGHDLRPSEPEALLISLVHLPGSWRIGFEVEVRSGAPLRHLLRVPPILLQVVLEPTPHPPES